MKGPKFGFQKSNPRNWLKQEKFVPSLLWLSYFRKSLICSFYMIGNSQPSRGKKEMTLGQRTSGFPIVVWHWCLEVKVPNIYPKDRRFTALVYICKLTITCIIKTCLSVYKHGQKYTSFYSWTSLCKHIFFKHMSPYTHI